MPRDGSDLFNEERVGGRVVGNTVVKTVIRTVARTVVNTVVKTVDVTNNEDSRRAANRRGKRAGSVYMDFDVCGKKTSCLLLSQGKGDFLVFKRMVECFYDVPVSDISRILGVSGTFFKKQIRNWVGLSWWPCLSIMNRKNESYTMETVLRDRVSLIGELSMYCNQPPAGSDRRTNRLLRNTLRILRRVNVFAVSFSGVLAKRKSCDQEDGLEDLDDLDELESVAEEGESPAKKQRVDEDWPVITDEFDFDALFEDGSIEDLLMLGPLPAAPNCE